MTTITLTEEQVAVLNLPLQAKVEHYMDMVAGYSKAYAQLQRRQEKKLAAADARTDDWKQRYNQTRAELLQARAEIATLKRMLRNKD